MKIGLLTLWRSLNYGTNLQSFALAKYLQCKGFEVSMINYGQMFDRKDTMMSSPMWYLGFFNYSYISIFHKLRNGFIQLFLGIDVLGSLWRMVTTKKFLKLFSSFPQPFYLSDQEFNKCHLPVVMIGSDQVWNPRTMFGLGKGYLLGDLSNKTIRLSYAAGISNDDFVCDDTGEDWSEYYKKALLKFSAISIRERTLIPKLESMLGRKVFWATDPTLLWSAKEWGSMLNLTNKKSRRHYTVYWISDIKPYIRQMLLFASKSDCPVHLFTEFDTLRIPPGTNFRGLLSYLMMRVRILACWNLKLHKSDNARDLVFDISTAEGVIADSYHALMFSVIYQRNARILIPKAKARAGSRMKDFLERVGWTDVIASDIAPDMLSKKCSIVNGSREKLNAWIKESKEWLNNILSTYCT